MGWSISTLGGLGGAPVWGDDWPIVKPSHKRRAVNTTKISNPSPLKAVLLALLALAGLAESKVWIARSNGTGMHEITSGPAVDETPALSPDGKRVVFARILHDGTKAGRTAELYSVATSGGEAVRLTENTVEDVNPVWSPDGRGIAFGQVGASNRGSIDAIDADGSGLRTVTSTGREYPDPDYSPNGRNIAFIGKMPPAPISRRATRIPADSLP